MGKFLKIFAVLAVVGSAAAGVYFWVFRRKKQPSVELYFEDGSMLALPDSAPEASAFTAAADEVLSMSPVSA